ncbi:hypothetical protein [Microcystis sp. M_QC_C_20170808_M2Col]|uniref:hypothetical protein n=1 Tax=Microcystis sp. M_QC_C_20170808_M2Col TaxID=2486215 RepID=UPI00257EC05B|nr:hypothetical protein [Microcystis sp. M_QC_C_20170808_M2Col]
MYAVFKSLDFVPSQLTIIDLTLSPEGWQNDVSRLDHQLERPYVPPSPFNLSPHSAP